MDRDIDSNSLEHDSMFLSVIKNSTAISHQNRFSAFSSSSGIQRKQSIVIKRESLNDKDECFSLTSAGDLLIQTEGLIALIKDLQHENGELKAEQAVSKEKSKRSELYKELITELRDKCTEKDKQLIEKANLLEILQVESAENNTHLQSESSKITQAKSDEKGKLIENLRAEIVKKDHQLQSQLEEINQLKAACESKDKKAKAMFDQLKELEKNIQDRSKLVDTLRSCGMKCWNQKQYTEALTHYNNAIELEKLNQNRPDKLSELLSSKAACHNRLNQHHECINSIGLSLQYDSTNKNALNIRACAYISLRKYDSACRDLKEALHLDPTFKQAQNNLKLAQNRINASKVQ